MSNNTSNGGKPEILQLPAQFSWLGPCLVIFLIVALSAFILETPAYCQSLDPPEEDCENYDEKEYNNRINCKAKKLNEKMGDVVDMIADIPEEDLSEKTKEHLDNSQRRMEKMRARTHEAKGFSKMARKQKATQNCYIQEIEGDGIGNDNGICGDDKKELKRGCVEETGDGDGICEKGGPVKETCKEVCDQENLYDEEDEEIYDPEAAADMEEALDDNAEAFELIGGELEKRVAILNSLRGDGYSTTADKEEDACESLQTGGGISLGALIPVAAVATGLEVTHEVCDDVAGTNVVGNNWLFACAIFAAAAPIADLAVEILELIDDDITENRIDAYADCLKLTNSKLEEALANLEAIGGEDGLLQTIMDDIEAHNKRVMDKLGEIEGDVLLLTTKVDNGFEEVETLLNTPQGKRPDWNEKEK